MGTVLFLVLACIVVLLTVFAVYMLVRILQVYARARRLETMRGYETILYAALPKMSPDDILETLLPDPDRKALEEVLLRMGDEGVDDMKKEVAELYRLSGFTQARTRQLRSRLGSRRRGAARSLGRIGDPGVADELAALLRDPRREVSEAALSALEAIGASEALAAVAGEREERGERGAGDAAAARGGREDAPRPDGGSGS
ncbi:MAG: HEAT repeat domain-containing protein [Actinomycetota bacterium]|nr:HEAT repeat domain-containing protein [Actinomycetota bacterium]MDD5666350.1 HEAT repeat domain-containing protein [Actinomycetota bacterium]